MSAKELPSDPMDPIWYDATEDTKPPPEAYRYFPKGDFLRNKGQRFIYGGNTVFDPEEEEKWAVFEKYLEEHQEDLKEVPSE
jgi:hypothetical protein